jgi:hypothetical protein
MVVMFELESVQMVILVFDEKKIGDLQQVWLF